MSSLAFLVGTVMGSAGLVLWCHGVVSLLVIAHLRSLFLPLAERAVVSHHIAVTISVADSTILSHPDG